MFGIWQYIIGCLQFYGMFLYFGKTNLDEM